MSGKLRSKPIDGCKLKSEVAKRFKSYLEADRDLGFSSCIGNWIQRNSMPDYGLYLIEGKWGVTYDMIKPDEPKPEPVVEETTQAAESAEDASGSAEDLKVITYKMMQTAAYAAVAEFCNKHLGSIIKDAVLQAMRERKEM